MCDPTEVDYSDFLGGGGGGGDGLETLSGFAGATLLTPETIRDLPVMHSPWLATAAPEGVMVF